MTPAPTHTYFKPAPEIQSIMDRMSLDEKIGQVMAVGFEGTDLTPGIQEMIRRYHVGGIILFARNVQSPQQLAHLNNAMQKTALDSGHPGLIISIDQEGGRVARLKETQGFSEFPGAMAIAATGNVENARKIAQALAIEMKAVGINADFAPDLDVNNNPDNPVINIRSFSSDPEIVAKFGVAFLEGLQEKGIMAFGKHFPGHGDTSIDSHVSLPVVPFDRNRLEKVEFIPFKAAMKANVAGIMSAHIIFPAIEPVSNLAGTLSPRVLTGLLRDELGFDGLLVTDSLEMGALATSGYSTAAAAAQALYAGADLLLLCHKQEEQIEAFNLIKQKIEKGEIPLARLDEAVARTLTAKARFFVLSPEMVDEEAIASVVFTQENKNIAIEVASQSITLLKNDGHILPLQPQQKILIIENSSTKGISSSLNGTSAYMDDTPSKAQISNILSTANTMHSLYGEDFVVVLFSIDATQHTDQAKIVDELLKANIKMVVVATRMPYDALAFSDLPVYVVTFDSTPAMLSTLPDFLYGKIYPQGHLPVEIPDLYPILSGIEGF